MNDMESKAQTYELSVCGMRGVPRYCVYLNNHRIAGAKPWGGAQTQTDWTVTLDQLCDAIPEVARWRSALTEALAFLDRIEGDGYGGMADYMSAQEAARAALAAATDPAK